MKKIIFLKIIIIFFFVTSCGYSPIFSQKEKMFSIAEINSSGDKKLNKIINKKLNFYKNSNSEKNIYLKINTELSKKIASRDQKGNPKTYRIQIISKISPIIGIEPIVKSIAIFVAI